MEDYPRTLLEFEKRFGTEEACREYRSSLRWPQGFRCPRCGGGGGWSTARGLWHCQRCRLQSSGLAGTLLQDTKKPLAVWFRAMWHSTTQKYGANAVGMQRVVGRGTYRIAWTWLDKLRCAMVRSGRDRMAGSLDVDETYIGGEKPGKRGRGAAGKALILVAAEEDGAGSGRIRLRLFLNASALSLQGAGQRTVEPGSGKCSGKPPACRQWGSRYSPSRPPEGRRTGRVRGRDGPFGPPPARSRTRGIPSYGSYLGCLAWSRTLGYGSLRPATRALSSPLRTGTQPGVRSAGGWPESPWSWAFPPVPYSRKTAGQGWLRCRG